MPAIAPMSLQDLPTTSLFRRPPGNTTSRNFCTWLSFSVNHTLPVAWNDSTVASMLLFRSQDELFVRADDPVVERRACDDLLGGFLEIDVAIDDHRHVTGSDAE